VIGVYVSLTREKSVFLEARSCRFLGAKILSIVFRKMNCETNPGTFEPLRLSTTARGGGEKNMRGGRGGRRRRGEGEKKAKGWMGWIGQDRLSTLGKLDFYVGRRVVIQCLGGEFGVTSLLLEGWELRRNA
jgi:hypothetical protein